MATRLYIESADAPPVSPAFDAAWDRTAGANTPTRVRTSRVKQGTAFVAVGSNIETSAAQSNGFAKQLVSNPLSGDQTISGTVKAIIRAAESAVAADMRAQMVIRVVSNDGSTVRGTLLAADNTTGLVSEFATGYTARKFPVAWTSPGATLTPVNALDGDRIVIEFGSRALNTVTTSYSDGFMVGSASGTDHPEDETSTAALSPWVEFSQDLVFVSGPAKVGAVSAQMLITATGPARLGVESAQMLITTKGPARLAVESSQMLITTKGPARIGIVNAQLLVTQKDVNWGRIRFGASLLKLPPLTFHEKLSQISGLQLHFDADQSVKKQLSDGTLDVVASGDPVGYWRDLVDTSRVAAQATAAARPVWISPAYQNKPVMRFDGGDDQLILPGHVSDQITNPTIFVVCMATAGGGRMLVAKSHTLSGWSAPYHRWGWYNNGSFYTNWNGVGTNTNAWSTGDLKILELLDGDSYANGVKVTDGADVDLTYPNGLTPILISGNGVGSERWAGDIAEIIVYNRSLTSGERNTVRNLLGGKYGINL